MESQSLGRTYLWVRGVIIVMTCLLCVLVLTAGVPVLVSGPVGVVNTLMQWVAFGASVLYAVWVYKLHQDLRRLDPEYPVSPGYAMALLLIPVYNIWGIWAMWMAVSDHLPAPVWRGRRLPRVSLLVSLNYVLVPLQWLLAWTLTPDAATMWMLRTTLFWILLPALAAGLTAWLLCFSVTVALEQKASDLTA